MPLTVAPARCPAPRFRALRSGCLLGAAVGISPWGAAAPDLLEARPLEALSDGRSTTLFVEVAPETSGLRTENHYADPRMWGALYHEFEIGPIGTGVTIGDYDGDGRPDVFVVSKTESCRLFRNLGDWRFEDVSEQAGVADRGAAAAVWKQGATFADVNNDGWLDLYVCRFDAPNLLYLNQGDGTFREGAAAAGLDVTDASTMASFADYDRDGWLDVFVQTNLLNNALRPGGQRDHLFRNNGDGTFTNVTERAGLDGGETQGNAAVWWDYDDDGWPDLYVANDFAVPDRLYRNRGDGTFVNVVDEVVPHVTYSSMGADFGDVNNDGLVDLLATDMAASSHEKDQRSMADTRGRTKDPAAGSTAVPNYLWNALFLNTGTGRMLEAARLAGLAATDWTWSVRWEDLDNDGRLDLHVTNGMHREIHNTDLILRMMTTEGAGDRIRVARSSPVLREANLAFRNLGDLQFEETGAAWGLDRKGVSFGAAFGDLDGDGDLDLVHTNYEAGATLLRNEGRDGHRVIFALRGRSSNRFGIGARVMIETDAGHQVRVLGLARGYMSSSEPIVHFGLGEARRLKRVTVRWPGGHEQVFTDLAANHHYLITEPEGPAAAPPREAPRPQFAEVSASTGLAVQLREPVIDEIAQQRLLPVRFNRRGPAVAVGDLDGDGREDAVVGGTSLTPAQVLWRESPDRFTAIGTIPGGPNNPTNFGPVLLVELNGDGRNDLLLTRGGNSAPAGSPEYQPTIYWGAETGLHPAGPDVLPEIPESIGAAGAADFNRDGRLDLFLGARVTPGLYPLPPRSYLLENRGGRLVDVTDERAPELREVGMVCSALWSDVDGDGWTDLLVAVEWGHVRYFHNDQGRSFEDWTERAGFAGAGRGWWTSLTAGDFNGDGRMDYLAGNVGLNTPYRAGPDEPALLYVADPPDGGSLRLIEAFHDGEAVYPRRSRRDLASILPAVTRRFPRNDLYARATLEQVVGADVLAAAERYAATELRSGVFLSQPDGSHVFQPLPRLAQIAPVQGAAAGDFDGDGHADLYLVQNSYAPTPVVGRFDGGLSQLLRGDGRGGFAVAPHRETGLVVPGDAKALVVLDLGEDGWPDFWVSRNDAPARVFRNGGVAGHGSLRVTLQGPPGNPTGLGAIVVARMADGSRQTAEVQAGSGWLSQSTAACFFGAPGDNPVTRIEVRWPNGQAGVEPVPAGARQIRIAAP